MIIASSSDLGVGRWRGTRCAAALEDLDDDHATAAARARRAMIGCSAVDIRYVVRRWRLRRRAFGAGLPLL
jgi:hypothetical protein